MSVPTKSLALVTTPNKLSLKNEVILAVDEEEEEDADEVVVVEEDEAEEDVEGVEEGETTRGKGGIRELRSLSLFFAEFCPFTFKNAILYHLRSVVEELHA